MVMDEGGVMMELGERTQVVRGGGWVEGQEE